ncbi:unnamed protein product [Toxocara canis]|uniref:Lipoprotein n=1 Tax=Toxocara canis TaxID=6265 RepID=A0A183UQW7_TOXCA|nr:unnamed protein product [Toxocara canis]
MTINGKPQLQQDKLNRTEHSESGGAYDAKGNKGRASVSVYAGAIGGACASFLPCRDKSDCGCLTELKSNGITNGLLGARFQRIL